MSSPGYIAPLTLEPRPSPVLRAALLAVYGLAAVGLLVLPPLWAGVGGACLATAGAWEWRCIGRRVRLCWNADGSWQQPGADGPSGLHRSTFLSRWLVVLALDDGWRVRRWVLARDALPPVQWRRLRARLRVTGAAAADGSPE